MKNKTILDDLVNNAFDFLNKAINELDNSPKYSIINFNSGLELILKAILFDEHWSLVVSSKQEADKNKFVSGNFISVSLDESASKLAKVCNSPLSAEAFSAFKNIRNHRNRMVHFFHTSQLDNGQLPLKHSIVKEQLKAWFHLQLLMTNQWKELFSTWEKDIEIIESSLKKHKEFLKILFDDLKPELDNLLKKGSVIRFCKLCGFNSEVNQDFTNYPYESNCLVCNHKKNVLQIKCTECSSIIFFDGDGFSNCTKCNKVYKPNDLIELLEDTGSSIVASMEGDNSWDLAHCSFCDSYETVVRVDEEKWICTNCLETFDSIEFCLWCNAPNTGDMISSYYFGCGICEGQSGHLKDRQT